MTRGSRKPSAAGVAARYERAFSMSASALARGVGILLAAVVATAGNAPADEWKPLFDGKQLGRWEVVGKFDFRNHGEVEVADGRMVLRAGNPGTAVRLKGDFPKNDYEVELEAMRVDGEDFFCGMTFPVGDDALTLILGGWGGQVTGLSCLDGEPAAENITVGFREFENGRWYAVRLRVTRQKVEAWVDKDKIVDCDLEDRELSIWFEPETVLPLSIVTWRTTGAVRNIRLREFGEKNPPEPAATE